MSEDRRPKFEIPVSSNPMNLDTVRWKLLYDGPKRIPSKNPDWADSYLYSFECDGQEYVYFATKKFAEIIQEQGATKDTVIDVARIGEKTDTTWAAKYVSGPQNFNIDLDNLNGGSGGGQQQQPQTQQRPQQPQSKRELTYEPMHRDDVVGGGKMYEPLTNYEVLQQILDDVSTVYIMAHEMSVRKAPKDDDGNILWSEERMGTATATIFIGLQQAVNKLVTGRYGVNFADINPFSLMNDEYRPPVVMDDDNDIPDIVDNEADFEEWVSSLTPAETAAYKAANESRYLAVIKKAVPRYSDNDFGAKGAALKFCGDELPLRAEKGDGVNRVITLRRVAAYAQFRNQEMDNAMAMIKAIEQEPSP